MKLLIRPQMRLTRSAAKPRRKRISDVRILFRVATASLDTVSASRTKTSAKRPRAMTRRYSNPASLAQFFVGIMCSGGL